jgi:hypothetical protein
MLSLVLRTASFLPSQIYEPVPLVWQQNKTKISFVEACESKDVNPRAQWRTSLQICRGLQSQICRFKIKCVDSKAKLHDPAKLCKII